MDKYEYCIRNLYYDSEIFNELNTSTFTPGDGWRIASILEKLDNDRKPYLFILLERPVTPTYRD